MLTSGCDIYLSKSTLERCEKLTVIEQFIQKVKEVKGQTLHFYKQNTFLTC